MEQESVAILLGEIIKRVHADAGRRFTKDGITLSQYQALMLLRHSEVLSMSEVKKRLLIARSGATVLIDHLEKKGLVERRYSSRDRRKVMVAITEKGKGMLEKLGMKHEDFMENLEEKIGKEDIETVRKSLKILLDFLDDRITEE